MPKLIHAVFVKNEAHCIENMLKSVLPCVDASYVLIDDRTWSKDLYDYQEFGREWDKQLNAVGIK